MDSLQELKKIVPFISWKRLCADGDSIALKILSLFPDKIDWEHLSQNSDPEALILLKAHPEKIDWISLCSNPNPEAVKLIREELQKENHRVNWSELSTNPSLEALALLEENFEKACIDNLLYRNSHPESHNLLRRKLTPEKAEDYFRDFPDIMGDLLGVLNSSSS